MIANQMLIDFDGLLDFQIDEENSSKKKKELQRCVCGAQAIGIKKFMPGHSDWCEVGENKTPLTG